MLGRRMNRPTEYSPETRQPRSTSWRMLADTATVGSWTAAVKVAGAVKVILAARLFGAGDAMDAFLIAFLLQNTQNRDTRALQLKLDELLRATGGARTSLMNLEKLSDEELARLQKEFERISQSRADRR